MYRGTTKWRNVLKLGRKLKNQKRKKEEITNVGVIYKTKCVELQKYGYPNMEKTWFNRN